MQITLPLVWCFLRCRRVLHYVYFITLGKKQQITLSCIRELVYTRVKSFQPTCSRRSGGIWRVWLNFQPTCSRRSGGIWRVLLNFQPTCFRRSGGIWRVWLLNFPDSSTATLINGLLLTGADPLSISCLCIKVLSV